MSDDFKFPIIRLELQAMKHTILHALNDHHEDLQKMIEASFTKSVEHLQGQLDAQVHAALAEVMSNAINQAAQIAADGLADELAEAMAGQVREIVKKRMTQTENE